MKGHRFADVQELRSQTANRSYMGCADCQEWSFQGAKRSNMGSPVHQ